jgi:hypothetical protein
MAVPARQVKTLKLMLYNVKPETNSSQSTHRMQPIPPLAALTYGRMVRREHATPELKRPFLHRKRIRVPSKVSVRLSKVVHGLTCTSN